MIILLTHRSEIREQLNATLQDKGYDTCVPPHRQDVMAAMKERHPHVIILDLYLSEPSGIQTLRSLRQDGFHGKVVVLSSGSMVSVLDEAQGLGIDRVVHIPAKIGERFDFGELHVSLETVLKSNFEDEQQCSHERIARRAHELYQAGGHQDGLDVQYWLQAEREVACKG